MGADVLLALQNPFVWVGLGLAVWATTAILRWAASGGRLPLRGRRGSASALASAGLAVQAIYQPGAKQIQATQQQEEARREDDDEGEPPKAGSPRPTGAASVP